jgi:hypothetical protein
MNKIGVALFLVTYSCSQAFAGKALFVLRADSDSTIYNTAMKSKAVPAQDSNRYLVHTARIHYTSLVNEQLDFVMRARFDGGLTTTTNATDNLNNFLDIFHLTHKWSDTLKLSIGKMDSDILGNDGIPFAEIYLASRARADVAPTHLYGTGVKLATAYENQTVMLMHMNQTDGTATNQTKSMYGVVHGAKLLEDKVVTKLSYHKDHRQAAVVDVLPTVEMIGAGVKYSLDSNFVSFDYLSNTRMNMDGIGSASVAAANKKNVVTSYLLDGGYHWDPAHLVRFRYDKGQRKAADILLGSQSITDYEGISLALEFKPFASEKFRYHAAFTQLSEAPSMGDKLVTQHLILGVLIVADLLK